MKTTIAKVWFYGLALMGLLSLIGWVCVLVNLIPHHPWSEYQPRLEGPLPQTYQTSSAGTPTTLNHFEAKEVQLEAICNGDFDRVVVLHIRFDRARYLVRIEGNEYYEQNRIYLVKDGKLSKG